MKLALREARGHEPLARACRALRARVYRDTLAIEPAIGDADDDGAERDRAELLAVIDERTGEVVGTMELRRSDGALPLLATREFELAHPWWHGRPLVEGSRFAVAPEHRDGLAPLVLFDGLRRYCRTHGARDVVAIVMLPDTEADVAYARAVFAWLATRTTVASERACPLPAFVPRGWDEARAASALDPTGLPPMVRALAQPRSTLASIPGYDPAVRAWSFLLTTRLGPSEDGT